MKTCPYCGKENPDDAKVCVVDQTPLDVSDAKSLINGRPLTWRGFQVVPIFVSLVIWVGAWPLVRVVIIDGLKTGKTQLVLGAWSEDLIYRDTAPGAFWSCMAIYSLTIVGVSAASIASVRETLRKRNRKVAAQKKRKQNESPNT
jgi:hypothetical protein